MLTNYRNIITDELSQVFNNRYVSIFKNSCDRKPMYIAHNNNIDNNITLAIELIIK